MSWPLTHCLRHESAGLRLWVQGFVVSWLVSLLVAQTLGQIHAVHHGGAGHVADASAVHQAHESHEAHEAHIAHEAHHDGDVLHVLFSPHQNEKECRLFDVVRDMQTMPDVAAILLPGAPPGLAVALFQGNALARWAALFEARGPPLTV